MEHVQSFSGFPALTDLQVFLASKKDTLFETSELYSSATNARIIDEELRKSRFRLFKDREIFDLVDQTVRWLNESDKEYCYQLRRDDITEIHYKKGDFFKKHKDYLSTTSNLVEEFTLILCVTPSERLGAIDGGETLIYPYASQKGVAFDTTTPGNGLLFRKDLEHAGNMLKAGEKHILTANLWATRKQASNQVLFVTFPSQDDDQGKKARSSLQQAANQETSYALPVDCLTGTMLEAHVRFFNQGYEQNEQELPLVVSYKCTNFTFDEFGTVFKILQRAYVHEEEIRQHAECIEFFGPFLVENLLVILSLETKEKSPVDKKVPAKKKVKTNNDADEADDLDVIVCENESRTQVVNEVARQLGFERYVPFKMLFVEGMTQSMGSMPDDSSTIPVTPVALLLGDYNHIFAIRKVGGNFNIDKCTLKEFHTKRNYWDGQNLEEWDEVHGLFGDDQYQEQWDFDAEGRGLGLKFALGEKHVHNKITRYVFGDHGGGIGTDCFRPLSRFSGAETDDDTEFDGEEPSASSLFHRDESGKATFTWEEADAASSFIASMDLDERVKACKFFATSCKCIISASSIFTLLSSFRHPEEALRPSSGVKRDGRLLVQH